ncbi:MAG: amino acid ABC transporter substrate-binding protein [Herpetosiphonaceae bacterium]|nr:MAG: amino acid ABC transporter substrate-binding protein [Herpetosiphonaceae bacterium]
MRFKQAPVLVGMLVLALLLAACGGASPAAPTESPGQNTPQAQTGATQAPVAATGNTLQVVRDRGQLICGVNNQLPGFGSVDAQGNFNGFDIDFCKAIAAAVFGDATKVQYRPLSAQERFPAVQTREVDVLIRNTTWTVSRDTTVGLDFAPTTFYDGQGMMVRKADNISSLEDMDGASVCVQSGTTTELNLADSFRSRNLQLNAVVFETHDAAVAAYDEGRCDGFTTDKSGLVSTLVKLRNPADHVILDVTMSKEPLGPAVLQGDTQWKDIVTWVVFGLFNAEELGVTQANVESMLNSDDPNIRRLLGVEGELGQGLGLDNDFMVDVIKAVGNYGEIYDRNLGPNTPFNLPRGINAQWTDGGLIYGPPFR